MWIEKNKWQSFLYAAAASTTERWDPQKIMRYTLTHHNIHPIHSV